MGILNYHYFVGWLYSAGKEDLHLRVYFEDRLVYDYNKVDKIFHETMYIHRETTEYWCPRLNLILCGACQLIIPTGSTKEAYPNHSNF